jgi:hypothetical protein
MYMICSRFVNKRAWNPILFSYPWRKSLMYYNCISYTLFKLLDSVLYILLIPFSNSYQTIWRSSLYKKHLYEMRIICAFPPPSMSMSFISSPPIMNHFSSKPSSFWTSTYSNKICAHYGQVRSTKDIIQGKADDEMDGGKRNHESLFGGCRCLIWQHEGFNAHDTITKSL